MGFLIVTMRIHGAAVASIAIVVLWLTARFIRGRTAKLVVCVAVIGSAAVISLILMPSTAAWILATTVTSGENVSPVEFRGKGPRLPTTAASITYYSNYFGSQAVFSIAEPDFLAWLDEQSWEHHEIVLPETFELYYLDMEREIRNGIQLDDTPQSLAKGVFFIIYDRDHQQCLYHYSRG